MLRDTEADFFANFKSAIVSTKQKLRGLVRILVGQNDAAVVPDVYGLKLRGQCFVQKGWRRGRFNIWRLENGRKRTSLLQRRSRLAQEW
jgi:hypothetical protein